MPCLLPGASTLFTTEEPLLADPSEGDSTPAVCVTLQPAVLLTGGEVSKTTPSRIHIWLQLADGFWLSLDIHFFVSFPSAVDLVTSQRLMPDAVYWKTTGE